ncbi:MAG: LPXTG cell wall anchor domain-containing protein [Alphaproteobacteria bacterium]|jgi:LPXTG-motif cell wall-anchored protein
MKLNKIIMALGLIFITSGAFATQKIEIYYAPSCPHCHHAMAFIDQTLKAEYKDLEVVKVNVAEQPNRDTFIKVIKKCKFQSGGVPVLVVNEKCFQGYAEFMNTEIMAALGPADAKTDDSEINKSSENKIAELPEESIKKSNNVNSTTLYILLGLLIVALGAVFLVKKKK